MSILSCPGRSAAPTIRGQDPLRQRENRLQWAMRPPDPWAAGAWLKALMHACRGELSLSIAYLHLLRIDCLLSTGRDVCW
jgi:hypothetical protein